MSRLEIPLFCGALVLAGVAWGQPKAGAVAMESARVASDTAQRMQARGELKEAESLLRRELADCGAGDEGRPCRQLVDYSLGYVLERGSTLPGAPEEALLRKAATSYEKVLQEDPQHGPTLDNLVSIYQRLGEAGRAASLLEKVQQGPPSPQAAVRLGDLYLQANQLREARRVYDEAERRSPGDDTVRHRLVLSYELTRGETTAPDLLRLGDAWAASSPSASRSAYEAAIRLTFSASPAEAERALVGWAGLLATGDGLSVRDLESLPAGWEPAPVKELRAFLADPASFVPNGSWWSAHDDGKVLAWAALSLGRERVGRGDAASAETIWQKGLRLCRPTQPVYLELSSELAGLYLRQPKLDRGGHKLGLIVARLFGGKGAAYARADLGAIQRFHVTLGLLYAERGIWRSDEYAHNALFQLERALEVARRRETEDGLYRPLAGVRERLADGYRNVGEPNQRIAEAFRMACQAYLDTDDMDKAARMLEAAGPGSPESAALARILESRKALASDLDALAAGQPLSVTRESLLAQEETFSGSILSSGLDAGFLTRQRFKLRADLASVAAGSGLAPDLALGNASATLDQALQGKVQLVGAGDLLRLRRLQDVTGGSVGLALGPPQVLPSRKGTADEGLLKVALPSSDEPTFVQVGREAALASRIVQALGPQTVLGSGLVLDLQGGKVTIRKSRPGQDENALSDRIAAVDGVEVVNVLGIRTPIVT